MQTIEEIARQAKEASRQLKSASGEGRDKALNLMAEKLFSCKKELFDANAADLAAAQNLTEPLKKRLSVTEKVFQYMMNRLREAAALPDAAGRILEGRTMPSGLQVKKVAVPIGVVAIIYEARPNVTTDAAAVALKSGNAVILKGGSESIRTNVVLAKAMREALKEAGLPYISVLTDPTTGGVSASYAMLGDINITEPGALIGFAGRRVIENTIHQKLPDDFQTAEYLLAHGFIDKIVPRTELKAFIVKMLHYFGF